jgi:xylan 1,4-beta-xylosidase
VGSEHAGYWLRKDLIDHHRLGKEAFGHEFVRFHGNLSEAVGVASRNKKGQIDYHWYNFDRVYDNVLDLGLKPFIEFSYMPKCMASGKQTIFYWQGNVTQPKSFKEWEQLIFAATSRLLKRYGRAELRQWYFEVWNEPNLPQWFFKGTQKDYFRLYDHAAEAVKAVDSQLRVGGPATACADWIDEFIRHCKTQNFARPSRRRTPVDFVSYHLYPTDPFFMEETGMDFKWEGEEFFRSHIQRNRDIVDSHADLGLEIHMTEWSVASGARKEIHDTPAGAAFIAKAIQEVAGKVDTFSWWTLTDIFEEAGLPPSAFHGGFGLLNVDGLKKPSYHAFECLQDLGCTLLAEPLKTADHSAGCIPTLGPDKSARLLFWGFHFPKTKKPPLRRVKLKVAGFPSLKRQALAQVWVIDPKRSNILNGWKALGSPESLTPQQAKALRLDNRLELAVEKNLALKGGEASLEFDLAPDSVVYVTLR